MFVKVQSQHEQLCRLVDTDRHKSTTLLKDGRGFISSSAIVAEIWSRALTNQLPQSWLARFQPSGQLDAKGQSQIIWRSHGQFDLESCPVQYPWLNPLPVMTMNLQNVDQHHFSSASGPCDVTTIARR